MRKYLLFFIIIVIFLVMSCNDNDKKDGPVILDFNNVTFTGSEITVPVDFTGICHTGYSADLDQEYKVLNELNVHWIHRDFSWSRIESEEGKWDFSTFDPYVARANQEEKKILGMLLYDVVWVHDKYDYPRERRIREDQLQYFVNYAVETVKRYDGKSEHGYVDAWLIWNEPDLRPRFWTGTQEEFFALTKATAEAIRPLTDATIIGGVFSPLAMRDYNWVTGLFSSGAMEHVDGIAFHPYSPTAMGSLDFYREFEALVPAEYKDKIWLNEMGYPTFPERGNIPEGRYGTDQYEGDMPEVVTKTFALLASAGARNLTWYHLFDGSRHAPPERLGDSEAFFGLLYREQDGVTWHEKGGYQGFRISANNIPGKTYRKVNFPGIPNDIHPLYFEGNDGSRTLIVWNNSTFMPYDVSITLKGTGHKLWDTATGESVSINAASTHTLEPMYTYEKTLVFLTWDE